MHSILKSREKKNRTYVRQIRSASGTGFSPPEFSHSLDPKRTE
jgi:hypothetical protein